MALKIWQSYMPDISAKGATLFTISPEKPENGSGKWDVSITATFVVEQNRHIKLVDCGPDYRQRLDPQIAISAL